MTPEQIDLVQDSFDRVVGDADAVASRFYERLFALDPALRPLFKGDIATQRVKLMTTIRLAVTNLKAPDALAGPLRELGARHRGYGVKDGDYGTVAAALLGALEEHLGPAFTPEVRDAWVAMYTLVADGMTRP